MNAVLDFRMLTTRMYRRTFDNNLGAFGWIFARRPESRQSALSWQLPLIN